MLGINDRRPANDESDGFVGNIDPLDQCTDGIVALVGLAVTDTRGEPSCRARDCKNALNDDLTKIVSNNCID